MSSARNLLEPLESRTLLTAIGADFAVGTVTLDPGFGNAGALAGYGNVVQIQADGKIIAHRATSLVRLNPDGTLDRTFNPATYHSPLPGLVQSNGKRVVVSANSPFAITRYNADGSLDKSFGVNGRVVAANLLQTPTRGNIDTYGEAPASSFGNFRPESITLQGDNILVSGELSAKVTASETTPVGTYYAPAIQRLTANGKSDRAFGVVGVEPQFEGQDWLAAGDIKVLGSQILLFADEPDADTDLLRFDTAGNFIDDQRYLSSHILAEAIVGPDHTLDTFLGSFELQEGESQNDFPVFVQYTGSIQAGYEIMPGDTSNDGLFSLVSPTGLAVGPDGAAVVSVIDETDAEHPLSYLYRFRPVHASPGGDVSGFIYNDTNSNGRRDPGEAPLRYWQAYADLNNNGVFDLGEPAAYADYNGYYKLKGLAPGKYIIREVRQDGWRRTSPAGDWPLGSYTVNITAGHVASSINFGNTTLALVSGTVYNDQSQNHKQDASEPGQIGWTVFVDSNNNGKLDAGEKSTTTDAHGNYSLAVAAGTYHIRVILNSGFHLTTPTAGVYLLTLKNGDLKSGENFGAR